jgi:hypothetical protein
MSAFANAEYFASPVVTWFGFDPNEIAKALIGYSEGSMFALLRSAGIAIATGTLFGCAATSMQGYADLERPAHEQPRWAYLISMELISKQEAEAWAERVWPSERGSAD